MNKNSLSRIIDTIIEKKVEKAIKNLLSESKFKTFDIEDESEDEFEEELLDKEIDKSVGIDSLKDTVKDIEGNLLNEPEKESERSKFVAGNLSKYDMVKDEDELERQKREREERELEKEIKKNEKLEDKTDEDYLPSATNPGNIEFNKDLREVTKLIKNYVDMFGRDPSLLELKPMTNPNNNPSEATLNELLQAARGEVPHLMMLKQKYPKGFPNARGIINLFSIKDNYEELYEKLEEIVNKIKQSDAGTRDNNRLDVLLAGEGLAGYNFHNRRRSEILQAYRGAYSLAARFLDAVSNAARFTYQDPIEYK